METILKRGTAHVLESADRPVLRIGVVIDSPLQPRWIRRVLEEIQSSRIASVVLIVRVVANSRHSQSHWITFVRGWRRLLSTIYLKLDELIFRPDNNALELVNIDDLITTAASIELCPEDADGTEYYLDEDVNKILECQLDVALYFGSRRLRGRALKIARHGVWAYFHSAASVNLGGPPGFWEVMQEETLSVAILARLSDGTDCCPVLYRSWSSTVARSVIETRNRVHWKSATFVVRKLRDLATANTDGLTDSDGPLQIFSNRPRSIPGNWEMTKLFVKFATRAGRRKLSNLTHVNQWFLAYELGTGDGGPAECLYQFRKLFPPADRFWADPFPVYSQGSFFIFLEESPIGIDQGHISIMEITGSGKVTPCETVLERDYHLSYPFVFSWRDQWYMIPETCQVGRVEVYKSVEFPRRWELLQVLLDDVRAVDTTLVQRDGRWWMFTNIAPFGGSTWDELHVFFSDNPLGPWTPHARNPVKSDVRSARPAGRLFELRGKLIRPAQDCSSGYGSGIVMHQIDRLTPTEFAEREVARILPHWHPRIRGTHTYNWIPGLTVIDGLLPRRKIFGGIVPS